MLISKCKKEKQLEDILHFWDANGSSRSSISIIWSGQSAYAGCPLQTITAQINVPVRERGLKGYPHNRHFIVERKKALSSIESLFYLVQHLQKSKFKQFSILKYVCVYVEFCTEDMASLSSVCSRI